jgi:hypothetical protein
LDGAEAETLSANRSALQELTTRRHTSAIFTASHTATIAELFAHTPPSAYAPLPAAVAG